MTEQTEERRFVQLVCVGMRIGNNGRMCQVWQDPDGQQLWYKTKLISTAVPGQIYLVCRVGNSSMTSGPDAPVYQGRSEDRGQVAIWEVEDIDARARDAKSKLAAKERGAVLEDMLKPVTTLYSNVKTREQARLLLAEIMRIVTRGDV